MVFKLTSIDKEPMVESPPIIYQPAPKPPKTKKFVIIGSFILLSTALIVVAILVGIHIYVEAQKVIKFTLQLDKERSQHVTSDRSSNIVQYFIKDGKTRAWIINDFNTDIKVTKIISDDDPSCYVTPLNRSTDLEPTKITKLEVDRFHEPSQHDSVIYRISGEPVQDISFLNREARRVCGDVPTYWMYPTCPKSSSYIPDKIDLIKDRSPYYMIYSTNQDGSSYPCVSGCCKTVCACGIKYSWMVVEDKIICNWITRPCCGTSDKCFYKSYCSDVKGLSCTSKCN